MPSGKEIKSTQRKERRVLVALDSAGAITSGAEHASVVVNGTGDRTLTLTQPAARPLMAMVSALEADCTGHAEGGTVTSIDILITDLAAAAADLAVLVEIVAIDSEDEI